jgi:hypothetical protein
MNDRMFHVLVLGGLALVGCGGSTTGAANPANGAVGSDASAVDDAFPSETASGLVDASGSPGAPSADAGNLLEAYDGGHGVFPSELPPPPPPLLADAGTADAYADALVTGDAGEYSDAGVPDAGLCARVPCELPK